MIEHLAGFPPDVVAISCKGRVTRRDYDTVLIPAIEAALKKNHKVRLYYRTDRDFLGLEPGAMWEDFKIGVEHPMRWERIAVVTDVDWIRHAVGAFRFLLPGAVKVFPLDQADAGRQWLIAEDG